MARRLTADHHDAGMALLILYLWLVGLTAIIALPVSLVVAWRRR